MMPPKRVRCQRRRRRSSKDWTWFSPRKPHARGLYLQHDSPNGENDALGRHRHIHRQERRRGLTPGAPNPLLHAHGSALPSHSHNSPTGTAPPPRLHTPRQIPQPPLRSPRGAINPPLRLRAKRPPKWRTAPALWSARLRSRSRPSSYASTGLNRRPRAATPPWPPRPAPHAGALQGRPTISVSPLPDAFAAGHALCPRPPPIHRPSPRRSGHGSTGSSH
jgi:hypothetical protein